MQNENDSKDSRLKYVEMPIMFYNIANDIEITCRQNMRRCEDYAKRIQHLNPKKLEDIERLEKMKQFLLSSHDQSTRTIMLLDKIKNFLSDVTEDASTLIQGAILRDKLKDASESLEIAWKQRDEAIKRNYEWQRTQGATKQS